MLGKKEDTLSFVVKDKKIRRLIGLDVSEIEEDIEWLSRKLKGKMDTGLLEEEVYKS